MLWNTTTSNPVDITENVLSHAGAENEQRTGSDHVRTADGHDRHGADHLQPLRPRPADMVVQQPELPETVKGVLANFTGV